ncbi:hypothetical protein Moror_7875 [Moniliophthora roreri MCA 2997]|uniref:F-box domain-containing protein n=2 Tax=Moniliophthora roreri TaxID=221103 RepID=V2WT79_MONRO|nr:hypothetical protein Moror_7875 [Moniliophthora roreri MCA 2997]KAI3613832.1 hypothetical protein WG66_013601 [Moniliophthora roreri]
MTPHPHKPRKIQMGPTQETEDEMVLDEGNRVLRPRKRARQDGPAEEVEPPAKKPKSRKPPLARPHARTRRRTRPDENTRRLSLLMDMPLDILFVILCFLPPKTLFCLMNVSNAFRELLTASSAATIWIRLRKSYNAPEPASFIDSSGEYAWARALFDESGTECAECGSRRKTLKYLDFVECKWICKGCIVRGAVTQGSFKRKFRGQDKIVLELLPLFVAVQLEVGGNKEIYRNADITKVISCLSACGDEASVTTYKLERLKELERAKARRLAFLEWRPRYHYYLQKDHYEEERFLCEQRMRDIKERILDLGYPKEDLVNLEECQSFDIPVRLTNASWESIKAEVLTIVRQTRKGRLMYCSTGVFGVRRQFIEALYVEFKGTFTPIDWREFPSVETVFLYAEINNLLLAPEQQTITSNDFALIIRDDWGTFLKNVREWRAYRKERFISEWGRHLKDDTMNTLARDIGLLHSSEERYVWKMPWQLPSMDFGNLAVAQLRCFYCNRICTTQNAAGKHQDNVRECGLRNAWCWGFKFSPSKAALQVIGLSGLNPTTASADDMDAKGDFFKCLACDEEFVGTWRECITCHDIHHTPEFQLLEDHNAIREDKRKSWACSLCNAHLVAQEMRATVIKHLESAHGTIEPKVPKDYLYAGAY